MRIQRAICAGIVLASAVTMAAIAAAAKEQLVVNFESINDGLTKQIVSDFEAAYPDVDLVLVSKEGDQTIARILAGQQMDVRQVDVGTDYQDLLQKDLIMPLDSYLAKYPDMTKSWAPAVMDTQRFKGHTYLIPRGDVDVFLEWTNETRFLGAGLQPPALNWTTDDFVNDSKKLMKDTNGDGQPDQWLGSWNSWYAWRPWFVNQGGQIFDRADPTKFVLASEQNTEALQWMADLEKEGLVPTEAELEDARAGLINGRVAMAQSVSRKMVPKVQGAVWQPGVTFEPAGPAGQSLMLTWQGFAIFKNAKDPDLAFEFIKFVTQPKYVKEIITQGFTPSVDLTLNSQYFDSSSARVSNFTAASDEAFDHSLILGTPMWSHDTFDDFSGDVVGPTLDLTQSASAALKSSLSNLQADYETWLNTK